MIIVLNPCSAGGTALKKWEKIKSHFSANKNYIYLDKSDCLDRTIINSIQSGETQFIAAGGDGTVNLLLNKLIKLIPEENITNIKLGAVGIGSSNDFHKPFNFQKTINGIPFKIDYKNAETRDVGCITYKEDNLIKTKYFLINASLGLTADANYFFNHPDFILKKLKRISTNAAILYAAVKTIFRYSNIKIIINSNGLKTTAMLTNLGVVKNQHFSGSLTYNNYSSYNNGMFDVHLCYNMSRLNVIYLLWALSHCRFSNVRKKKSWSNSELEISSENKFNVEYDGEIISTDWVKFNILPNYIKVCK